MSEYALPRCGEPMIAQFVSRDQSTDSAAGDTDVSAGASGLKLVHQFDGRFVFEQ